MSGIGSQQSNIPNGLPCLPGNGFRDPTVLDFKCAAAARRRCHAPRLRQLIHIVL